MLSKEDSIQVLIRIRDQAPFSDGCLLFSDRQINIERHYFGFDRVFHPQTSQEQIYQSIGLKLIENTFQGYNGCVFVYGQTGSGKTYTMVGEGNGLIQRAFYGIFQTIKTLSNSEILVSCSFLEIYNQQILDLLDPYKKKKMSIRQDTKKGTVVDNLMQKSIQSPENLLTCLSDGLGNRHIGETMMNRQSSRSHCIFSILISCKTEINGTVIVKTPKLYFVDLAGSQRQKSTLASGGRLKEATNINKSLTTLGMVINCLSNEKKKTHVPFRNSKLTNLLRESLGGNSRTFIIATVSNSVSCLSETLSTLNFASRAKMIPVNARVNQKSSLLNTVPFQQEITKLKQELLQFKKTSRQSQKQLISEHFELIEQEVGISECKFKDNVNKTPTIEDLILNFQQRKLIGKNCYIAEESHIDDNKAGLDIQLKANFVLLNKINNKMKDYLRLRQQLELSLKQEAQYQTRIQKINLYNRQYMLEEKTRPQCSKLQQISLNLQVNNKDKLSEPNLQKTLTDTYIIVGHQIMKTDKQKQSADNLQNLQNLRLIDQTEQKELVNKIQLLRKKSLMTKMNKEGARNHQKEQYRCGWNYFNPEGVDSQPKYSTTAQLKQMLAVKDLEIQQDRNIFSSNYLQMKQLLANKEHEIKQLQEKVQLYTIQSKTQNLSQDKIMNNLEETHSKIQYYEEKFHLMSLQYRRVTDEVRKLKQRQIAQKKPLGKLKQNLFKQTHQNQISSVLQRSGHGDKGTRCQQFDVKGSVKLTLNQEQFKKRLQAIIQKGSQCKQNNETNTKMSLEELTKKWESIENQSLRKIHLLSQAIQKEQRLKVQNNYVLKQNMYLRQKVKSLQTKLHSLRPDQQWPVRKIRKLNQAAD